MVSEKRNTMQMVLTSYIYLNQVDKLSDTIICHLLPIILRELKMRLIYVNLLEKLPEYL